MTHSKKEISVLLYLVDDPDNEVFETVAGKLLGYGKEIIPQLEELWETTTDAQVQYRIENLIHRALFQDLQTGFADWAKDKQGTLLDGAIWIARYRFPDTDADLIISEIEQIQKNIWLELNHYLSPLEQVNVINSILYSYYKINGDENVNKHPNLFCLNHLLESKHGNSFTVGILYLITCEALDIPVFAVDLPRQFVLAYFDSLYHFMSPENNPIQTIQFYIDPVNGMVYTQNDVRLYLQKINAPPSDNYLKPLNAKQIIHKLLGELATTYTLHRADDQAKEVVQLQKILERNLTF